jgi:hypothetical protein
MPFTVQLGSACSPCAPLPPPFADAPAAKAGWRRRQRIVFDVNSAIDKLIALARVRLDLGIGRPPAATLSSSLLLPVRASRDRGQFNL